MTTSGQTAWLLTVRDLVKQAMSEIGVLSPGEEPDAAEMDDCIVRLNAMLKSWATVGGLSFLEGTTTVTVPAATASVALALGIRSINSARVVESTTNHRAMVPYNRSQYQSLPNKIAVGTPTVYYVSDAGETATLNVWPVPAAATTISVDYGRTIETVTDPSETLDMPQEWQEAVYLNLASRIASMYGATRLDPTAVQDVMARADRIYGRLLDADRPDSYFFEPYDGY